MTQSSATQQTKDAMRPFQVNVPEAELTDLRRRIHATRWPEKETVSDASQGVQLATIQALARYWAADYDWRRIEAKINALPNFMTEIDGLEIHFIHVRSKHDDALPLIVTHGWPGSITERSLRRPSVLGELGRFVLRRQRRHRPHRRERVPGRAVPCSTKLGRAGISQTNPLQQAGKRRPLCGLGAAETFLG